ncbi:putative DNA ligase-like protein [Novipirellula galeiformis]|uniref:DNA ligase (ATP) n=1 Tax=Novipirellula galeiformis TaxID=2528004 RepID=A0A5C6CTC3_9BACT|nr:ATP-dependent DNA ligase [Novipirellula galeiformis]TWU26296.1 putative DNA ligase-like protein [Novipirellula galeiformis]
MMRFAALYHSLDSTTKTNAKIVAMADYFSAVAASDAAWATYFLSGNKLRRLVPTKLLRSWAAEEAGIASWLFEESYHAVGDLAETLSLIVPPGQVVDDLSLTQWVEERLLPLRGCDEDELRTAVVDIWRQTSTPVRFVIMKLITGAFRVGVSKRLVTRAIAEQSAVTADVVSHRLMGNWEPTSTFFQQLIDPDTRDTQASQPYPFCLAHPIEIEHGPAVLGDAADYVAEWKWDGIRGQVIRRQQQSFIWSRGEELMENRWPEIEAAAAALPNGTVLDGEILACRSSGEVLPFAQLQRRIGRKSVGKKLRREVPVVFHAFDLLEHAGVDIRELPLIDRRARLENLLASLEHPNLAISDRIAGASWDDWAAIREHSREHRAEGLMLKRNDSVYDVGRVRGTWWKWKVAPYTIDAVLIYAQKGHGRRASLFTDYTFALWDEGVLVPFAKAYSGLQDKEIREVDRFVRKNTKDSFGPVRSVTPALVMELAFEGLQRSPRHKSGVATRFPRILRWRHDKRPQDANQLSDLLKLAPPES